MSEATPPARRPLFGLVVIAGLILTVVAGFMIWQQARWLFAAPLAVAFHEYEMEGDKASVSHAEVRKFISLDLLAADELAKTGGFDCKALRLGGPLVVCYRDVWTGLCKDLWSLELTYDDKKKITRANGRKRRVCLFGSGS